MTHNNSKNFISPFLQVINCLVCSSFVIALISDSYTTTIGFDYKLIAFNIIGALIVAIYPIVSNKAIKIDLIDAISFILFLYIMLNYYTKFSLPNNSLFSLLLSISLFLCVKQLIQNSINRSFLLFLFAICFLTVAIMSNMVGIIQLIYTANPQMNGTFYNSGPYGIFCAANLVFSVGIYLTGKITNDTKEKILRAIAIINIVLSALVLPATYSRAAWLGFIVSFLFLLYSKHKNYLNSIKRYFNVLSIVLILVAFILGVCLYNLKKDSADGRLVIWKTSLLASKKHIWTGIGYHQIQNKFADYQIAYFKTHNEEGIRFADKIEYAFNDYLEFFVENGLIGLLLFLLTIFLPLFKINISSLDNPYVISSFALCICLLVCCFFSYPLEVVSIRNLFLFGLGIIAAHSDLRIFDLRFINLPVIRGMFLISSCVLSLYILTFQYKVFMSKQYLILAQKSYLNSAWKSAEYYYQQSLSYTSKQKSILPAYGLTLLKANEYQKSIAVLTEADRYITDPFLSVNLGLAYSKLKRYNLAENAFIKAIDMEPNKLYPRYLLTNLYRSTGKLEDAKCMATQILEMPIRINSTASFEIKSDIRKFLDSITVHK